MKKFYNIAGCFLMLIAALGLFCACAKDEPGTESPKAAYTMEQADFDASPFKHINNGGVAGSEALPYNIDAITGATVTVEGPAVVTSVPLSMREIENRSGGLFRGLYSDSQGNYIYEGLDLYHLLNEMTDGDSGILLTDEAYSVDLRSSNRITIASFTLGEVKTAHDAGRPIILAYGLGSPNGAVVAPFVFDAANPSERSEGYIEELDNDDGCLRLVYDLEDYGDNAEYTRFSNVAYVYLCEEKTPGFKHLSSEREEYAASRYTDYIISFRGSALGYELDFTVGELEDLTSNDEDGELIEGGVGFRDYYSLANTSYWYVNEYEGLDLYKLLIYLGMEDAETMGLSQARMTLVSFIANDGVPAQESFSVDTLSYPDAFGFYNKNAADLGDGTYVPSNADLVELGYPVLLAYGVNRYPYTITKGDAGYLSGLSNSGGPMRVVFGKTQYSHANGSNQVQYLREVIVGEDVLYNTHKYTDNPAQAALAEDELFVSVSGEDGKPLMELQMSVGDIEDLIYSDEIELNIKKAAQAKDSYEAVSDKGYVTDIYEGVSLDYFLMEVLALPGTNGTVTFHGAQGDISVNLDVLLKTGYNTQLGRDRLIPLIAFSKNGAPLVPDADSAGYVKEIPLHPSLDFESPDYRVDNQGGSLAVIIPSSDLSSCDAVSVFGLTGISIELLPDAYAHTGKPYDEYAQSSVRFCGDGLEQELEITVAELEGRQRKAETLDFCMTDDTGSFFEGRYRGIGLYELFTEIGIKSNAGDVTVYASDGTSAVFSLSALKNKININALSPNKAPQFSMLAFGSGIVGSDSMLGRPLVPASADVGYDPDYKNDGGPLMLIVPNAVGDETPAAHCVKDVVAVEVSANEIDTWGHDMSDIYAEFSDYEFTFTVKNDDNELNQVFTVSQLEEMEDIILRESYSVLDIGECEGLDIWKFIMRHSGDIPGIDDPVAITVYASDGYKNDLLSVFYKEGFTLGVPDEDGNRKPLILAYAINGLPLVDSESHEGYAGAAGNTAGPLRVVAETNQGASVKYVSKLVVTIPGSGPIGDIEEGQEP